MAKCQWTQDEDGAYDTECGNKYEITNGTPKENRMKYCTYCGKQLDEATETTKDIPGS